MSAGIVKRSIEIAGHRTSITLEDEFWAALREIAEAEGRTLRSCVAEIDAGRGANNLSSAIRLRVLDHYRRDQSGERRKMSNGET